MRLIEHHREKNDGIRSILNKYYYIEIVLSAIEYFQYEPKQLNFYL